jgi:hypothetical protein
MHFSSVWRLCMGYLGVVVGDAICWQRCAVHLS